jgi:uncharacterized protein YdaU (DUF1376 family)
MENKKLEFFAWYAFDFRADTHHLTRVQRQAYRDLIDEIFITAQDTCQIVDDDVYLQAVCQASEKEWLITRRVLIDGPRALLQKREGHIFSERLEQEIRKAQETVRAKSQGGAEGRQRQLRGGLGDTPRDTPSKSRQKKKESKSKTSSSSPTETQKKGSPNGDPRRGAAIEKALLEIGVNVHRRKTWPQALNLWLERATETEILEAIETNKASISTADRPLQYTNAIIAKIAERRPVAVPPLAEVVDLPRGEAEPHKFKACYMPGCENKSPHCLICEGPDGGALHLEIA